MNFCAKREWDHLQLHEIRQSLIGRTGVGSEDMFHKCDILLPKFKEAKQGSISGFSCGLYFLVKFNSKRNSSEIIDISRVLDLKLDNVNHSLKIVTGYHYVGTKIIKLIFKDEETVQEAFKFIQHYSFRESWKANHSVLEIMFKEWLRELFLADSEHFNLSTLSATSKYYKIMSTLGVLSSGFGQIVRKVQLKKFTFKIYVETFQSRYFPDVNYNNLFSDLIMKNKIKFGGSTLNKYAIDILKCCETELFPQISLILPKIILATSFTQPELFEHQDCDNSFLFGRPIKDYYCASSHNTYLVLNQYGGRALPDPYRYVLLKGVRCIELDIYDADHSAVNTNLHQMSGIGKYPSLSVNFRKENGNGGEQRANDRTYSDTNSRNINPIVPIVTHTQFLNVTPTTLEECLIAIADTAFVASPLPIVLSLENHCSVQGQHIVANLLVRIFGDMIVDEQEYEEKFGGNCLLKDCHHRIFIKNKKSSSSGQNKVSDHLSTLVSYYKPLKLEPKQVSDYNAKKSNAPHSVISFNEVRCTEFITGKDNYKSNSADEDENPDEITPKNAIWFENKKQMAEMIKFSQQNSIRVYPKAMRLNSSNFNPMPFINCGIQMIALNFQKKDYKLKSLTDFFQINGNMGYIMKPKIFLDNLNCLEEKTVSSMNLNFRVVTSIRQLVGDLTVEFHTFGEKKRKSVIKVNTKRSWKVNLISGLFSQKFYRISHAEASHFFFKFKTKSGKSFTKFCPLYALSDGYSNIILEDPEGKNKPIIFLVFVSYKNEDIRQNSPNAIQIYQKPYFESRKLSSEANQSKIICLLKSAIFNDANFDFKGRIDATLGSNANTLKESIENLDVEYREKLEEIAKRLASDPSMKQNWEKNLRKQKELDLQNLQTTKSNTKIKDLSKMMMLKKKQEKMLNQLQKPDNSSESFKKHNNDEIIEYVERIRNNESGEKFKVNKFYFNDDEP